MDDVGVVVESGAEVTAGPVGGVVVAVAVLLTDAGVHVGLGDRVASVVQVVDAPGASVVTGQVTGAGLRVVDGQAGQGRACRCSSPGTTTRSCRLRRRAVGVDVTRGGRRLVEGQPTEPSMSVCWCSTGSRSTVPPDGCWPRRRRRVVDDAGVDVGLGDRVRRRVQVVDAPGARVVTGQVTAAAFASVTARALMVTVPVFVTRNDQGSCRPGRSGRWRSRRSEPRRLGQRRAWRASTSVSWCWTAPTCVVPPAGLVPVRWPCWRPNRRRRRPG